MVTLPPVEDSLKNAIVLSFNSLFLFSKTENAKENASNLLLGTIRVVGSRHSFSQIANTNDTLVSLVRMSRVVGYNSSVPSISIQAGLTYSDLVTLLDSHGFALPNLAALSGITIAGGAATGAHGSGVNNTNLAGPIIGMTVVLANGSIARWTRAEQPELMRAAAVSLGAFGVVTELTLKLEPSYKMETNVFQRLDANFEFVNLSQVYLWLPS